MDIDRLLLYAMYAAWIGYAAFVVWLIVRTARRRGLKQALLRVISLQLLLPILVPLTLSLLSASIVFIYPQETGVVISAVSPKGIRERSLRPGLHWIVPLLEQVERYPIFWQTYTMSSKPLEGEIPGDDAIVARTADGQEVALDCSVIFRIDPEQVNRVHIDWQDRYIQDFVRPAVRGIVRSLVSAYTVDEVNSDKRRDLESSLDTRLRSAMKDKGFILDQYLLRNIDFSDVYRESVEEKQVALQQATQREHQADQIRKLAAGKADEVRIMASGEADAVIVKAQAEAEARIIKAEAEAQALGLVGQAIEERPDLLTYTYIQKLSPSIRAMLLPSNTPFILPLPSDVMGTAEDTIPTAVTMTVPLSGAVSADLDFSIPTTIPLAAEPAPPSTPAP
jgi:regulator of protease activity HflC (stomatin/prohibitin superfamily)